MGTMTNAGSYPGSRTRGKQLAATLLISLGCRTGLGFVPSSLPLLPLSSLSRGSSQTPGRHQLLYPTPRPSSASFSSQDAQRGGAFFSRAYQGAASHFSSFFGETNSSSIPLAYELRMLELEERVLKLEGMLAKSSAKFAPRGGATGSGGGVRDVSKASGSSPSFAPMDQTLPFGEQLLLACTFAGALLGLLAGKALLRQQLVLGGVGGAIAGVWLYNKEGNYGECIRAMGKLVMYTCGRLNYAWQELKFNWKAWRVYERSFKKLEMLDREIQLSEKLKTWDRQYQVTNNVNMWWRKAQGMAKSIEDNVKDQITHFQRSQRLQAEQQQAWLIQQEIARQQAAQQAAAAAVVPGPAGPGAASGPSSPYYGANRASRFETGSIGGRASTDMQKGAPSTATAAGGGGGPGPADGGAGPMGRWGEPPRTERQRQAVDSIHRPVTPISTTTVDISNSASSTTSSNSNSIPPPSASSPPSSSLHHDHHDHHQQPVSPVAAAQEVKAPSSSVSAWQGLGQEMYRLFTSFSATGTASPPTTTSPSPATSSTYTDGQEIEHVGVGTNITSNMEDEELTASLLRGSDSTAAEDDATATFIS